MYSGYRYEANGRYHAADPIGSAEAIMIYLQENKKKHPEIRITNSDDHIVAEAKNGHIVFPEYLAVADILDELRQETDYDPAKFMQKLVGSNLVYEGYIPGSLEDAVYLLQSLHSQYVQHYQNQKD